MKMDICFLNDKIECSAHYETDVELQLPSDWKTSYLMDGLNIANASYCTPCFEALLKAHEERHGKSYYKTWEEGVEGIIEQYCHCPIVCFIYDNHVLYSDMLDNMVSISTYPIEVMRLLDTIMMSVEKQIQKDVQHCDFDEEWINTQTTNALQQVQFKSDMRLLEERLTKSR
jgi:hypothetical protein